MGWKEKINKKNILIIILVIISTALFSLFFGGLVIGGVKSLSTNTQFGILSIMKASITKDGLLLAVVSFILLLVVILRFLAKNTLFSVSSRVAKSKRANSNMHGESEFITPKDMDLMFGQKELDEDNNFKRNEDGTVISLKSPYSMNSINTSSFNGYMINAWKKNGQLLFHGVESQNALVLGPNGSGKTRFLLGPTIQANAKSKLKPSMVINDLKGELYEQHGKVLADNGYQTIQIDFRQPRKSLRFNPLDIIWDLYQQYIENGDEAIVDKISAYINDIANIIVPPGKGDQVKWDQGSQGIVKGIIWAMLEDSKEHPEMTKSKFTFAQISNILTKQSSYLEAFLTERPMSSKVWDYAAMVIGNQSEKTLSSYISNTQTSLTSFLDSGIQYITSASDISFDDILDKPTAFFFLIPDENDTYDAVANLMIVQLFNFLTYKASLEPNLTLPRTWYFLLDEFGNMKELPAFKTWISAARSRNIFFMIIVQSLSQLDSTYGAEIKKVILQNCHFQMFLGSYELTDMKYFQDLFGTYTVFSRSSSITTDTIDKGAVSDNVSLGETELVTIHQLQNLKMGEAYFYSKGLKSKVNLVPIHDKELTSNGTFISGSYKRNVETAKIDFNDTFYDIELRSAKVTRAHMKKETIIENHDELVDVTDQFKNENTNEIKTLTKKELFEIIDDGINDSNHLKKLKRKITKEVKPNEKNT